MEVKNVIVGVIFVVVLYVVYIYAFKNKHNSLIKTQKVDSSIKVDVSGNSSSNAYSMWLFISEWNNTENYKHVMSRESKNKNDDKLYSPTVYLDKTTNMLTISDQLDVDDDKKPNLDKITISDFPIQSWTNLIISTNTTTVDIYINGKLIRSHGLSQPLNNPRGKLYLGRLNNVDTINYPMHKDDDDETAKSGVLNSYNGYISTATYFDEPITPGEAWKIYTNGYDGAGLDPNVLGKYKIKMTILDNNKEMQSVEI